MHKAILWFVMILSASCANNERTIPATMSSSQVKANMPKVTLLEVGISPKKILRFVPGQDSTTTMSMTIQVTTQNNVMQRPQLPIIAMEVRLRVMEVQPNGDFSCEFTVMEVKIVGAPGVKPTTVETMRNSLKSMIGLKIRSEMSNRGLVKKMEIDVPSDVNSVVKSEMESMRQALEQFVVQLPEEAVGIGGKWKIQTALRTSNLDLTQESIITLEKLDGDQLSLQVAIIQTAPPRDIHTPGMPSDTSVRLSSFASKGHGQMKLRLGLPFPIDSEVRLISDTDTNATVGEQNQSMKQQATTTLTLKKSESSVAVPVASPAVPPEKR